MAEVLRWKHDVKKFETELLNLELREDALLDLKIEFNSKRMCFDVGVELVDTDSDDDPPSQSFDRVVRLRTLIGDRPMHLVSFIDNAGSEDADMYELFELIARQLLGTGTLSVSFDGDFDEIDEGTFEFEFSHPALEDPLTCKMPGKVAGSFFEIPATSL